MGSPSRGQHQLGRRTRRAGRRGALRLRPTRRRKGPVRYARRASRRLTGTGRTRRAGRRPSACPTDPQLTNSTPPYSRVHGLWVWPKASTRSCSAAASRSYSRAGLSSNRYSLTFRGEPCTRWTSRASELEVQVERQVAQEILGLEGRVRERPVNRELAELTVVRGDVCAAAVLFVARDGVVVVPVDRRGPTLGDQRADLVRVWPVTDEVPSAEHVLDPEALDPRESTASRAGRFPWMSVMTATLVSTAPEHIH